MSGNWYGRGFPDGPDYDFTHNNLMYTNPPPPLNFPHPPHSYPTIQDNTHHYPDPQGVSPPVGPELDYSDLLYLSSSRPSSSMSHNSITISPPLLSPAGENYVRCYFCPSVFPTISLSSHLTTTHSSLMFHCRAHTALGTLCAQQFLSVPQLRTHLSSQHIISTFSSDKLAKAGTITLPKDLRMYRCKSCPQDQAAIFYGSAERISAHIATSHPELTASNTRRMIGYECRACDKYQLDDQEHLLRHIKLRHSRTRKPSVEPLPAPVPRPSPSPEYVAPGELESPGPALSRCTMCPSPGLVHMDQVTAHQKSHSTALFTCAACDLKYELYLDVESHIKVRHKVVQASSIRESIRLPDRELLVSMECGVCHKQFVGQGEQVLISHIESTHGKYYVGIGGGKNLVRLCRICDELFTDGVLMQKHLDGVHTPGLFANDSDGDDEVVDTHAPVEPVTASDGDGDDEVDDTPHAAAAVEPVTAKSNSGKVAFMDIFKEEVAKRKAEYDAQEAETRRLRKLLVSDSSDSDDDEVVEVKRKKREKQSKKTKKSRRRACSSDEEYYRTYSSNGSTPCSGNSVPYNKYKTHLSNSTNTQYQDNDSTHNIDLRTSSTEKLLLAKEMVRQSIQKEENRRRGASSFEDDLRKMKTQLSETLKKSRQLTDKYRKDGEGGKSEEGRGISIDDDNSLKSVSSVTPTQVEPLARPKFKMTWKK